MLESEDKPLASMEGIVDHSINLVHGTGLAVSSFMAKPKKKIINTDPLFELFEHYLFNRSFDDSAAFTREVAEEYLAYLDSTPAHVPFHSRMNLLKDLEAEAHELLIKKMYGCVSSNEYQNFGKVMELQAKKFRSFGLPSHPEDPTEDSVNTESEPPWK